MEYSIVTIIAALVLVAIVWKIFGGIVKTIALLAILAAAAWFVFAGGVVA
tara:strand:- start:108 stop:257 length:150 start_codon:yes stop_codon:yes gene_type:complete